MRDMPQPESRESIARREVGQTTISRAAARLMLGGFLLAIYGVPLHQHGMEWRAARTQGQTYTPPSIEWVRQLPEAMTPIRQQGLRPSSLLAANRILLQAIQDEEDRIDDEFRLGKAVRPIAQELFIRYLGVGNEQAYVGRDGWLFYRPGLDYLTGPGFLDPRQLARRTASGAEWQDPPQPDPRVAIIDFHRQLKDRGIHLILMPTPIKPGIHPEQFSRRFEQRQETLYNRSYPDLLSDLKEAGVDVFDPANLLIQNHQSNDHPAYLATDTHWRPEAMEKVAQALAARIAPHTATGTAPLIRSTAEIAGVGDIALMLTLSERSGAMRPETVSIRPVLTADQQFWRPSESAEVLILGDSFSNIFSLEPMGWGTSAGFVEQVAYFLQAPVDRLVRNDSGAFATRDMLRRELARGRDRLADKTVVVWQFAARELAVGDWRVLPMVLESPSASPFLSLADGEYRVVTGTVQSVSPAPRPGTVPYRDHVISLHLVDLPDDAQALVYMLSMVDNVWTRAASIRPGEELHLVVRAWADVADQFDALNRSELDDFELQLEEPVWGEWKELSDETTNLDRGLNRNHHHDRSLGRHSLCRLEPRLVRTSCRSGDSGGRRPGRLALSSGRAAPPCRRPVLGRSCTNGQSGQSTGCPRPDAGHSGLSSGLG